MAKVERRPLASALGLLMLGLAFGAGAASAQTTAPDAAQPSAGIRGGNITSTGETVPNPGASKGAGTTSMDRGIQREDDRIQGSICKGC